MIYILLGNDTKHKSIRAKELVRGTESVIVQAHSTTTDTLISYASIESLFGGAMSIQTDNIVRSDIVLSIPILKKLQQSKTVFIFLEDKLLATEEKRFTQYAVIERFEEKSVKQTPKINIFNIADAYERKDKITAWSLYRSAIDSGIEPESISGILFWKIKTMILANSRAFSRESLITQSSEIVSLYHKAHTGELDFSIGLEQFILTHLAK